MARRKKHTGPTPVEQYEHAEHRVNNPTADAADTFYDADRDERQPLRYPRDPSLDPQLVWRGKDAQDGEDLEVDAPPIYIQEKVSPRALIENLRKTAKQGQQEPEVALFETFDELDDLSRVEFYQHQEKWKNRMILGDSLQVMGSLAERENLRGQVQMIYIDPPYGIKFNSNWQVSTRRRDVKDGNLKDAPREAEQVKAYRDTWELGIHSYLSYLRDRLVVARDLLTESGSVFVQIGDENVHLVRCLLDEIFGRENFVSQIKFSTTSGFSQSATLSRTGDYLVWYARDLLKVKIRKLLHQFTERTGYGKVQLIDGHRRGLSRGERDGTLALPEGSRVFNPSDPGAQGEPRTPQPFEFDGKVYYPSPGSHWKARYPQGMEKLAWANRIYSSGRKLSYVRFSDDYGWAPITDSWDDTVIGGFTNEKIYVVQTTSKVISRCVLMATDPGDLILDPTCGSGTTAFASEQWGRRWITIDTSRVALALARQRLMGAKFPYYYLADTEEGRHKEQEVTGKPVPPNDQRGDVRQGFVYERVPHITLKSIANNPDIHEGMPQDEIDEAIARYADSEILYDRPYEDKSRVRVAGPFTVESLSPHRSLSFDEVDRGRDETQTDDDERFAQSLLQNLQTAGIQNGHRAERLEFSNVDAYPGTYIQAIGQRRGDDSDAGRVAIALGPQYGTVSPRFVKEAAREAINAGLHLVAVLGFAFDPQTTGVAEADGVTVTTTDEGFAHVEGTRDLGRAQVLLVRMNADLLMGEALKKTGSGNLFTVFGEPDVELEHLLDGRLRAHINGVDVYDPNTGRVRSSGKDQIALWMIDTDYDGESFFVRHCYFTGGNDPYKRLKTALKADIDKAAWQQLYSDTSLPFDPPSTGRIAIKVINDYGDEVMTVRNVDN